MNIRCSFVACKIANPTFAQGDATIERCGIAYGLGMLRVGEQMRNEEMMQVEEPNVLTEREAWARLHEFIWKELFDKPVKKVLEWPSEKMLSSRSAARRAELRKFRNGVDMRAF